MKPENVAAAITRVRPWAVDVASGVGVEPGKKDPGKLQAFAQSHPVRVRKGPEVDRLLDVVAFRRTTAIIMPVADRFDRGGLPGSECRSPKARQAALYRVTASNWFVLSKGYRESFGHGRRSQNVD